MGGSYSKDPYGGGGSYTKDPYNEPGGKVISAPKKSGGGGILGAIEHAAHVTAGKVGLAAHDVKSIPGGFVQAADTAVVQPWKDFLTTGHVSAKHNAQIDKLTKQTIDSTVQSIAHPLRDPFQTILNLAPAAHALGAGLARGAAAADAAKAGEGAAGVAKALASKPEIQPRLIRSGEGVASLHPSRNPAVRAVQGAYDKALQHGLDTNPEGRVAAHAAKRIHGSLAETTRFQQRMRQAVADDLERAGRQLGSRREAQAALRLTSENSTAEEAAAFHRAQAAKGVEAERNGELAKLYDRVAAKGTLTRDEHGNVTVNAEKFPEIANVDAKLAAGQTHVDKILRDYGLMTDEGMAARRDLPGQIRRAGASGHSPVLAQDALTESAAHERLATLDAQHRAILERIVPEVSPYGGDLSRVEQLRRNFENSRAGKGNRVGASKKPTVKAEELQLAEAKLHDLIGAHPNDPTLQRIAKMLDERQQLRDLLNARAEAGIAGAEAPKMPAVGKPRVVGFTSPSTAPRAVYGPQGRGYVPYKLSEAKASRTPVASSAGPVVGAPRSFVESKAFTGAGLEKGLVPDNTTALVARHMRRAFRFVSTDEFRKAALETGAPVRRSSRDVLVRIPGEKGATKIPLEIDEALGRRQINLDELHGHEQALSAFLDRLIPGRGDNFATDRAQAIGTQAPRGYRWVDRNVLGGHATFRPRPRGKIARTADSINSAVTAATVYFKVGHIGTRVLTNAATTIIQGSAAPRQLARSFRLWQALPWEDRLRALAAAGQHGFAAMPHEGENVVGRIATKGAQFWAKHADAPFRFASIAYEARRAGYRTPEDFQRLLAQLENPAALTPAERARVVGIAKEANRAGIAYDRLNDLERNYISRAVWFLPWVKGSTAFAGHTFLEHPYKSSALGNAGVEGRKQQQAELGDLPSYEQGLFQLLGGQRPLVSDFSTFSPFATPADVVQAVAHPADLAGFFNPVAGAASRLVHGLNSYGSASKSPYLDALLALASPTPEEQLARAYAGRNKDQSGRMFHTTPLSVLLRYLVGPAMPRRINPQAAHKAAALERSGR